MTVDQKARYRAFRTHFEVACIMGIVVIAADMTWLAHDIVINGFSIWYGFIGAGMLIGLIGTLIVVVRHNRWHVKKTCKKHLKTKLEALKSLHKQQGKSHNPRGEKK